MQALAFGVLGGVGAALCVGAAVLTRPVPFGVGFLVGGSLTVFAIWLLSQIVVVQ